jgi:arylsulfatase A-like enzyme
MNRKPHLLIFNPDQFRNDALHHMGCEASVTPNLDRTVKEDGISFRNAFCQNPVCTPSRCSFMSGWYTHVNGHRTMYHMMRKHEPVLLKILKENGYFVWWGGKNDLVPGQYDPLDYCDVINVTKRKRKKNLHQTASEWRGPKELDNYYSFYAGKLQNDEDGSYIDNDWAQVLDAIDFIKEYKGEKPLCIYLPLAYPHPPYGAEEPYYSLIDRKKVNAPIKPYTEWSDKPSILKGIRDAQHMENWSEERLVELKATYLAMCARIDTQYGLLLEALKHKGIYDDTAVFTLSDHGDFTGDYGLVEKTENTFQDCLINVPLIFKPPAYIDVKPRITEALTELIDFTATIYELAGIEPGYTHFGKSLIPNAKGDDELRDAVFCEGGRMPGEMHCSGSKSTSAGTDFLYSPRINLQIGDGPEHSKAVMVRTKEFKYIYRVGEKHELYNLSSDPDELINVIDDSNYFDILQKLQNRMLRFFVETGDVVPFDIDERWFAGIGD